MLSARLWFTSLLILLSSITGVTAQQLVFEGDQTGVVNLRNPESRFNRSLETILGENENWELAVNYEPGSRLRQLADPVGQLRFYDSRAKNTGVCTASLIAEDLILTNHHCIPGAGQISRAKLAMGYYAPSGQGMEFFDVVFPPVEKSHGLDFSILQVKGDPGKKWGTVKLAASVPGPGEGLMVIHHPGGGAKRITRKECIVRGVSANDLQEGDFAHRCDTIGGSSGAPIFDVFAGGVVVGLHYSGTTDVVEDPYNYAKRIDAITKASQRIAALSKAQGSSTVQGSTGDNQVAIVSPPSSPHGENSMDQAVWEQVSSRDKIVDYEAYLDAYPNGQYAALAKSRIKQLQQDAFPVGKKFKDCDECPEMIVVPAGSFRMGDLNGGGDPSEKHVRTVSISKKFAMGVFEVTKGQFEAFVTATGHNTGSKCDVRESNGWNERNGKSWRDPGFQQTVDHPVVCVNWQDAQAYVDWLNSRTEGGYRLPSESEWEYVARAGTSSKYTFGDSENLLCAHGNVADDTAKATYPDWQVAPCADGYTYTAPVGTFALNGFGLHDIHGNVWEKVQDCWSDSYKGAPTQGGARITPLCIARVGRGGSWDNEPRNVRSASRVMASGRISVSGFRIARDL